MAKRSIAVRAREVLAFARQLAQEGKSWLEVQNALFGVAGKCTMLFPIREERRAYLQSEEHRQVGKILAGLYVPPPYRGNESLDNVCEDLHVRLPHRIVKAL